MNQWENDFISFENELLSTRKKLNDLIFEYENRNQNSQDNAIYQDKLRYLEVELQYINNQLQLLKHAQAENGQSKVSMPVNASAASSGKPNPYTTSAPTYPRPQDAPTYTDPQTDPTYIKPQTVPTNARPRTAPERTARRAPDYEKLFGKNLMGIFASILIFISLVIFATLILPHLTDALKMLAMYIASAAVLSAGLLLYRKNRDNLFYIAIIGCGAGSLYLSLLLSNLYFKVIGDLVLYGLILLWAVFVKYLTRIKNLVFNIIGQSGIFIASVLGTTLCVHDYDIPKYFALSVFYFISAVVFSNIGRTYLQSLFRSGNNAAVGMDGDVPFSDAATVADNENKEHKIHFYEHNLCTHICKTLNVIVYTIGLALLTDSVYAWGEFSASSLLIALIALLFMGYLTLEFVFAYLEECKHGLAFQILSMTNAVLFVCLFHVTHLLPRDWTFVFMYLVSIAALCYVEIKNAEYKPFSQIWCFGLLFTGCINNPFMVEHLYAYLTVVPFMLYGKWKEENIYLGAGVVYLAGLPLFVWSTYSINDIETLVMLAAMYGVFLYVSRNTEQSWFKIAGYIAISFTAMRLIYDISRDIMENFTGFKEMSYHDPDTADLKASLNESIRTYASLITFYVLAVIHLVLSKLEFFGKGKVGEKIKLGMIEGVMIGFNAMLMFAGCVLMYDTDEVLWKLPLVLITILLFLVNSKSLLLRHKHAGYYVAIKYTLLMLCILGSYDVVDYATSICLLVFAIISIVTGFYKNTIAFRLYGLVLSMISIVKLIMFDIKYDSTVENAVSFFVSGVLCFVISFIYNRIDGKLRGK